MGVFRNFCVGKMGKWTRELMQKVQPLQPFAGSEWHPSMVRVAFCLATFMAVGMGGLSTGFAEPAHDLVISKDGGNVNVNLNTNNSSDVSIRRSDDVMVIKVPKSYTGGLSIDPALKKNSVVQE